MADDTIVNGDDDENKNSSETPKDTEMAAEGRAEKASEAARALGRLGASKGGRARAAGLSPDERSEIARKAVTSRWARAGKLKPSEAAKFAAAEQSTGTDNENGEPSDVPEESPHPKKADLYSIFQGELQLGDVKLECHVLNNSKRVLTQREVMKGITGRVHTGNLKKYLNANPAIDKDFDLGPTYAFRPTTGPNAIGYEATALIEICSKYLEARSKDLLTKTQLGIAAQCEIIVRACAKVGIIALIDEATGYQEHRSKNALRLKLQAFIADDLQEWARMFPEEFWFEIARLEGIRYKPGNRPIRWGKYVMMFVYDAIDEDVGRKLREINPDPHFLRNHHQWLKKWGRDKVTMQISNVMTIMKLCRDMRDFKEKFAHVFKKSPLQMTFDDINIGWGEDS